MSRKKSNSKLINAKQINGKRGHLLVARNARVVYAPTTKVASSTMRLLLAQANGTYRPEMVRWTDGPNISVEQSIHNKAVSGLEFLEFLPENEQRMMLESPDWWRIGALRNPYSRLYSAWENRILFRAPNRMPATVWQHVQDVKHGDLIDIGTTFRRFVETLDHSPDIFGGDPHFKSQREHFALNPVNLTYTIRLDRKGDLADFATRLGERVDMNLVPERMNIGLGVTHADVMDQSTGALVEKIFHDDFETFDFVRETFPESAPERVATLGETRAIEYSRALTERLVQLSQLSRYRTTNRYLVAQALRNLGLRR
jgi:hypothetical protein